MSDSESSLGTKAAPGWYPDPKLVDTQRYWDGQGWTEQRRPKRPQLPRHGSLFLYWVAGIALVLVGGTLMLAGGINSVKSGSGSAASAIIGLVIGVVGGIVLQVAVIATGVHVGNQNSEAWKRRNEN
ncbi:MAG: DUF2510 domain-containing protein [Marmoricola sp.]